MNVDVKSKLSLDVFKENKAFHIRIRQGKEGDVRLMRAILLCPAGLYKQEDTGIFSISEDGCLECGTCLIACGDDVLEWSYPGGGTGVQYRFG